MPQDASSNRGPWIVAGAIVLVGIIVVIVLVLLLKPSGSGSSASPSPSVPSISPTPVPTPTATHTRKPKPSPTTTSPTPTPTSSPTPNQEALLRAAVDKKANKDRPNEVKHVGNVSLFRTSECPSKQAGQANVRYTQPEKVGVYIFCLDGSKWVYLHGPIYGE